MSQPSPDPVVRQLLEQQPFLQRLARALTADAASADDLVQDANALVLRRRERPSRTWLATVLRNLAISERRSRVRRSKREQHAARPESADSDLAQVDRRLDGHALLAAELRRLPVGEARALALRYCDGLSPAEIASRLGEPEATVKTRLRRGLASLRARLDDEHGRERWLAALVPAAPVTTARATGPLVVAGPFLAALFAVAVITSLVASRPAAGDAPAVAIGAASPPALATTSTPSPLGEPQPSEARAAARRPALGPAPGPAGPPVERPSDVDDRAGAAGAPEPGRRESLVLSMKSEEVERWSTVRVHVTPDALDEAPADMMAGRVWFEAEGLPRRDVELRGGNSGGSFEMRVPAEVQLSVGANLDGYDTRPEEVRTAREGRSMDIRLAPRLADSSGSLSLMLTASRAVGADALSEGSRWLVVLTSSNDLEMPMRNVFVANGQLAFGRVPAGKYHVVATPYGVWAGRKRHGLEARAELALERMEALTLPVTVRRTGTFSVTASAPSGERLEAQLVELREGAPARRMRFEWEQRGSGHHTHRQTRSIALPPLSPGPTTLRFTCDGFAPTEVDVVVLEGAITDLDVTLWPE